MASKVLSDLRAGLTVHSYTSPVSLSTVRTRNLSPDIIFPSLFLKAYLAGINYFCTFTYDDKKHTEDSFRKGLQTFFRNLCYRKGWKYMGVWERSPENKRLHFHGLFAIPENAMVGMLFEKTDYSFKTRRKQTTVQNTYFN